MAQEAIDPIKIFFCYARKDSELRKKLDISLAGLRRLGQITTWCDREIEAGQMWKLEIDRRLNTADIILLLISPDFFDSDYCYGVEMHQALERHKAGKARIIPIILRPASWEAILGDIQALPFEGKPITTWQNRDAAFKDVVEGLELVVQTLLSQRQKNENTLLLNGRYEIRDCIHKGHRSNVHLGWDHKLEKNVAIRIMNDSPDAAPEMKIRFLRGMKTAAALTYPHIVQIYDYGLLRDNYFIIMEFINGPNLRRYLRSRGILSFDRAIIIAYDIANGLKVAHREGIIHRDVKPANILISRDGAMKLTDFGIASVHADLLTQRLTPPETAVGTPHYMAPEQLQGQVVSSAADVYSLGIVLYEMLTGHTPFEGTTLEVARQQIAAQPIPPGAINPTIPPGVDNIILRCLEKDPIKRYEDGNALQEALLSITEDIIVE